MNPCQAMEPKKNVEFDPFKVGPKESELIKKTELMIIKRHKYLEHNSFEALKSN
jgi:hypothetical protein